MKKLFAVLLALCLVVGMVPVLALADEGEAASSDELYYYWDNWEEFFESPYYEYWYLGGWSDEDARWEYLYSHYPWWAGQHEWWGKAAYVNGQAYDTFDAALAAAKTASGATIYVARDVSLSSDLELEDVSLVGPRRGVSFYGDNVVVKGGSVTLKNISLNAALEVEGGTAWADNVDVYCAAADVNVAAGATFYMYDNCGIDYIAAAKGATVSTSLTAYAQADGSTVYTDDVTAFGVAVAGGKVYETVAAALAANDSVKVIASVSENISVAAGKTVTIARGVTVSGSVSGDGTVYNYGTISGVVSCDRVYSFVDIGTVPAGATVTVWASRDGWHDWDWRYHNWYWADRYAVNNTGVNGEYLLSDGWYCYRVAASGYETEYGWFKVESAAKAFTVSLEGTPSHRVSVDYAAGGSAKVEDLYYTVGSYVYITVNPSAGYQLDTLTVKMPNGYTVDVEYYKTNTYRFVMPDTNVTVTPSFKFVNTPFADVRTTDWFYDDVCYVYWNDIMDGVSAAAFAPDANTTRAMVVTTLYRMAGSPAVSGASKFTDVASGSWYASAVAWASANGIVTGRSETVFDPNASVTREELVSMLYRYAKLRGYDVSVGESTNILSYKDISSLSEYAIAAMQWACGADIIDGTGSGYLSPKGTATRAQLAAMLTRLAG